MRILFLTPYVPSRIRVRPFYFIKELAKRHEVHVLSLAVPAGENAVGADELQELTQSFRVVPHSFLKGACNCVAALPTRTPMCAAYCRSRAMSSVLAETLASHSFDILHVEHLRAAVFLNKRPDVPVVFDSVDCLTGLFDQVAKTGANALKRLVALEETWKLRHYEPRVAAQFDGVLVTSGIEKQALNEISPELRIDVVPNGVDTSYFSPAGASKYPHRVVFSGKMSYQPNADAAVWFAEQVFGRLRDKWPDAEFIIAGSGPTEAVRRLAERPGISVTGYVPDLRPYLESSALAVAPMGIAVGVQNKVLEAMAMGLPVVLSPLAARSVGNCESALVASDEHEWAEAVADLMGNPDRAAEIGRRNRDWVGERFSWDASARMLESIYERLATRR